MINEKGPILITPHPSPLRLAFHAVCLATVISVETSVGLKKRRS